MHHYKAEELTKKQQYKLMSGSVIPRPIAWVSSLNSSGDILNIAPFSFFSGASNELPLITVSILRKSGEIKDTAQNILDRKEAVVHVVTNELGEEMNQTSSLLPSEESELSLTSLNTTPSNTIDVPGIKEAKIRFETTLHQYVPIKDDAGATVTDLFILKISDFYFDQSIFDHKAGYILQDDLHPLARLSGNNYATLNRSFTMVRPDK